MCDTTTNDLLSTARRLREWAATMGGWESPVWSDLDKAIEAAELAEAEDARPAPMIDEDGNPCCPHCQRGDLKYVESIENCRDVNGIEDGTLVIDAYYETGEGYDDGEDGRLFCPTCCLEIALPEGLDIDFV